MSGYASGKGWALGSVGDLAGDSRIRRVVVVRAMHQHRDVRCARGGESLPSHRSKGPGGVKNGLCPAKTRRAYVLQLQASNF